MVLHFHLVSSSGYHQRIGIVGSVRGNPFRRAFINGTADMMKRRTDHRHGSFYHRAYGRDRSRMDPGFNAAEHSENGFVGGHLRANVVLAVHRASFLIPSSSGAWPRCSIPIMFCASETPLGLYSTSVMIAIFQRGNGLGEPIHPTKQCYRPGGFGAGQMEYSTWLKFGGKLFRGAGRLPA